MSRTTVMEIESQMMLKRKVGDNGNDSEDSQPKRKKTNEGPMQGQLSQPVGNADSCNVGDSNGNTKKCFSSISKEIIVDFFQYLPTKDLITMEFKTEEWYEVAQMPIVWEKKVLKLNDLDEKDDKYITFLKGAPLLKIVDLCGTHNFNSKAAKALLQYTPDLHEIKIRNLTLDLILKIIAKFRNLKSVTLEATERNFLVVLEVLKLCEKIETLSFFFNSECVDFSQDFKSEAIGIFCAGFPALKTLKISCYRLFENHEEVISFVEELRDKILQDEQPAHGQPTMAENIALTPDMDFYLVLDMVQERDMNAARDKHTLKLYFQGILENIEALPIESIIKDIRGCFGILGFF